MGRYYSGDIEGKFWFAVQSSDDADNFGVQGVYDEMVGDIYYYFDESHLSRVNSCITECIEFLGSNYEKIKEYFKNNDSFTEEQLAKFLEINEIKTLKTYLELMARIELGKKIYDCVRETGECEFNAET